MITPEVVRDLCIWWDRSLPLPGHLPNATKALVYGVPLVPPSTSNGHISARKTTQTFIRAPLESPRSQFSNGARMSV